MVRALLVIVLLGAGSCGFDTSSALSDDGGSLAANDGGDSADAYVTPPSESCPTWNPEHFESCDFAASAPALTISSKRVFDTSLGKFDNGDTLPGVVIDQPNGPSVYAIRVLALTISGSGSLVVEGQRPLVILSTGAINIEGALSVGSGTLGSPFTASMRATTGPGANDTACTAGAGQPGTDGADGPGGGGGGGFGGEGGAGGLGDDNGNDYPGGPGGLATDPVVVVRGGCPGGHGGTGLGGTPAGGASGGALELVSATSITISGTIYAGGAGGEGGRHGERSGGGGGGSGGYVGLDAPLVSVSGVIAANGGGGGEGSDQNGSSAGQAGADGTLSNSPASGGGGQLSNGGDGGNGQTETSLAQNGSGGNAGAGGGGGSVGHILVWSETYNPSGGLTTPSATWTSR